MSIPAQNAGDSSDGPLRTLSIPEDALVSCRAVPPESDAEREHGTQRFDFEISRRQDSAPPRPEYPIRRVSLNLTSSGEIIGLSDLGMYDGGVRSVVAFLPVEGEPMGFRIDVTDDSDPYGGAQGDVEDTQSALSPEEFYLARELAEWLRSRRDECE